MDFTLAALIRQLAAARPDQPAITCGDDRRSFADLDARSSQLCHALLAAGVGPGDRVAVLAQNRPEFFEVLFGASKANAVLVGLNWRLAAPEIAAIIEVAEPALLLVGPAQLDLVPSDQRDVLIVFGLGYEDWLATARAPVLGGPGRSPDPGVPSEPDDVVLQLYSSGTTGAPKGAMLTNANLSFTPRMGATSYAMGPDSVNLLVAPLFHIGGTGYALTTMGQGGHTVLMPQVDPAAILHAIATHRVTHAFFVPAIIQALLDAPEVASTDLSSLEVIAYGGSPMGESLLLRAIDTLACNFLGVYGMTETAGSVLALDPRDHDPGGPRAGLLRSVGLPLPWLDVGVFDPDTGEERAPDQVGEIWVRSGQNMAGYWHQPETTAETLTAGGWLRTGDAAYCDAEGYFYLHDRIKDMIISGGENVYPAEVENVLADHPAVKEVAVIGVPHERWGETVKAIVVPEGAAAQDDLVEFARARLARYKCPTSVDFVDELPHNASGKVLKKVLREPYW